MRPFLVDIHGEIAGGGLGHQDVCARLVVAHQIGMQGPFVAQGDVAGGVRSGADDAHIGQFLAANGVVHREVVPVAEEKRRRLALRYLMPSGLDEKRMATGVGCKDNTDSRRYDDLPNPADPGSAAGKERLPGFTD